MTADPRPGWYPDPAGDPDRPVTRFRWWDGSSWGEATSDSATAPTPASRPSRLRSALVLAVGFSVFVGAALGGVALLWRDPSAAGPGRPRVAPSSTVSAAVGGAGQLDFHTRVATIGGVSMRLPAEPYALVKDPKSYPGLFDVAFLANATVHENTVRGREWSSSVMLTQLTGSAGHADLAATGRAALHSLGEAFFLNHPTTVSDLQTRDHPVDGCQGVQVTGRVNYDIPGLPSRYDTVSLLVVELADGTLVAGVSSVPDDSGPDLRTRAEESLASLTVG